VDVLAAGLVLDERQRVRELADIVVITLRTRVRSGSAPIASARPFREVAHHQRGGGTCPGVSTRSRRRSGCDGFASSRSWNTVRIPNRLPRTAKPPADQRPTPLRPPTRVSAPTSSRAGRGCREAPITRTVDTTRTLAIATAQPGLDKDLEPIAAADRHDPGKSPAEERVGREFERIRVSAPADHRQPLIITVVRDAGSRGGWRASIPATCGRDDEGQARSAGGRLSARSATPMTTRADQEHRVVTMPEVAAGSATTRRAAARRS